MQVTIGERLQELAMRAESLTIAISNLPQSNTRRNLLASTEYVWLNGYAKDIRKRVSN